MTIANALKLFPLRTEKQFLAERARAAEYAAAVADGYHPKSLPIPPQRKRAANEQPDPLSPATRPCL